MAQYNPKSLHAEEFINHEEILETLKYAEENKHNIELIDSILEKARPQKTATGVHCAGPVSYTHLLPLNPHIPQYAQT